ncbi:HNH endonuclease [Vibrio sp. OCN044]|uniref:HNH endonuclease n=1 Tax=Vibrio tetraodonis subsp. pristinus TaxID=2695891 RepID=A0A6L8M035_9VIBR|nr:HNH endonuclease signature motif containing protein [Vibrio tetraodonis]MYM58812.1 HNH endonuclease [Vibrio tetraodonis subsp. pristinus]
MYWWVNHKQTYKEEITGGYIWSPKTNANGARNQSYENMRQTRVGDIVFSFAFAEIRAAGEVIESCISATKPDDFGDKGSYWDNEGWLVKVDWMVFDKPFRPKDHIEQIRPYLPEKYSPIQKSGNGNQGCYLASISEDLAHTLFELASFEYDNTPYCLDSDPECEVREANVVDAIRLDRSITGTEKEQLITARKGQGRYRKNLERIETCCRVTGLKQKSFLIASHCKPWRDCNNQERLDGNNGLLLSPHIDKLFDKGWISFAQNGDLLVASEKVVSVLHVWGVKYPLNVGSFTEEQETYLSYHRLYCFSEEKI